MVQTDPAVISAVKVSKTFRDFWLREKVTAVQELDLEIGANEVFGLLGPNGSGKTTMLKMILGLLFPTRGRIAVFGRPPTDVVVKSRIGFLPEESYLYPFLDATETLDYYGRLFRLPARQRRRRIEMLLDMVGLKSVAYRRVGEYSKGMQRRIGLAQALINDPDLLILDEPTSGLDPIGTKQIKDLIRTLGERGKTVLLSSHLLADVEDVCDRVCILYAGRQRSLGKVNELLGRQAYTQLTTEQLDAAMVERVRTMLEAAGREIIDVATPRDKLEDLFLRIVQQAQEKRDEAGGVVVGGEVAEFLRAGPADLGRAVIEQLVSAAPHVDAPPQDKPPAETAATKDEPAGRVLEELVAPTKPDRPERRPGRPKPPAPRPARRADPVDQKIIDDLVNDGSEAGREDH